ncbi:MAG TPA: galactokinase [Acidimicrobiales bacterium]|nr:galactokinase [Acidimicrobiales bacterium]
MIITRTPLRISLGGGGTDLPGYYREAGGGFLVAAAVTKYVYIAINDNFEPDILLKYSQVERVSSALEVQHPLLREALLFTDVREGVEISSMADIPAGTGLGSSGAFTVGLLKALTAYRRQFVPNLALAEQACHIEIDRLGEPIGKQDQYIAAVGGLTAFEFHPDDSVEPISVPVPEIARRRLEENLLLFYTGVRRSASEELSALDTGTKVGDGDLVKNLNDVRACGRTTMGALEKGDLETFAALLTEQWKLKYHRSPSAVHRQVDEWISAGVEAGAGGGKLIGAGGGGFLLFYAEAKADLREAMRERGLQEVPFHIDYQGTSVIVA